MAVQATAVWRVRPSGNNSNGGGYDGTTYPGGTDYSQQNTAQLSLTDLACTTGTSTLTSATGGFTAAMVGNAIQITAGTNFTVGVYFISAFTNANTVTLDRSPVGASSGSVGTGYVGGAWADFWTNTTSALNWIVPGNTIYILGGGIPNKTAYAYDYTASSSAVHLTLVAGNSTAGLIRYFADPATPNYSTGGMPCIAIYQDSLVYNTTGLSFYRLWFVVQGNGYYTGVLSGSDCVYRECVFDQHGWNTVCIGAYGITHVYSCECFDSTGAAKNSSGSPAIETAYAGNIIIGSNVHDYIGPGISFNYAGECSFNVVRKCGGYGIYIAMYNASHPCFVHNNTIDANGGNGITFIQSALFGSAVFNNIISNHTTPGTYGLSISAGTASVNNLLNAATDYNVFYNNTTDLSGISYGPHATSNNPSAPNVNTNNPYNNQSTGDYSLTSTFIDTGYPQTAYPSH